MHILYIGQTPRKGTGSPVIIERHLKRLLEAGNELSFCLEWGEAFEEKSPFSGASCYTLPRRKFWWPPFRQNIEASRKLQSHLWACELSKQIKQDRRPDVILTYMAWHSDLFAEIGAKLGLRLGIPVLCLVHDDATAFAQADKTHKEIRLRQCRILSLNTTNAYVCPELRDALEPIKNCSSSALLWPIPNGGPSTSADWNNDRAKKTLGFYAGYCWKPQAALLSSFAGWVSSPEFEMIVMGGVPSESRCALESAGIRVIQPFNKNEDAIDYLREKAGLLVVAYGSSTDEMPWAATSFPSKLIEYSHLGIPVLILAPEDTAVMKWCRKNNIRGAFSPHQKIEVVKWVESLTKQEQWMTEARLWLRFSRGIWDPAKIQEEFENLLQRRSA